MGPFITNFGTKGELNPLNGLIPKIASFILCHILGPGHVWGPGFSLGRIWGGGGGVN